MKKPQTWILLLQIICFATTAVIAQQQGLAKTDSLLRELKIVKADTSRVNLLIALAAQYSTENPDTALKLCNEALTVSEKINWHTGISKSYHGMAVINYVNGNYNAAIPFYVKELNAWELLEKTGSKVENKFAKVKKANALNNIGGMYDFLGNSVESLIYYEKALIAFEALGDKQSIAGTLVNKGIVYSKLGNYSRSIDNYFIALRIFEELNYKMAVSMTTNNIGIVYEARGDYSNALKYYFKALNIAEEIGDNASIASDKASIATVYVDQKKYPEALDYNSRAFDASELAGDKNLSATILNNQGDIYEKMNEYKKAMDFYTRGLKLFEEVENKNSIASALGNIGQILFREKKYAEAEKLMLRSLSMSDSLGALNEIMKVSNNLSTLYAETHNYEKALFQYQKSVRAKDSLFSDEKTREIARKEFDYEQDKKDVLVKADLRRQKIIQNAIITGAAVLILFSFIIFMFYKRRRDAVQKQKETSLNLQVSETEMKALRSQMNPHFIFNALNSIQTFIMSHQPDDANDYLVKFSKLMRLILENSQYSEVSLKEDMKALELYMELESIRQAHPFSYEFHVDEQVDTEETNIPPLILQPFVENSIWHGFQNKKEPGKIDIFIARRNNMLFIAVEDNGTGRSAVQDTVAIGKESLGLKLTQERLNLINQQMKTNAGFLIIDLFTKENIPSGTRVELLLPLYI